MGRPGPSRASGILPVGSGWKAFIWLAFPWQPQPRAAAGAVLSCAFLQMGYLRKNGDGGLLYSVVNTAEPDADGAWAPAGLGVSEPRAALGLCTAGGFRASWPERLPGGAWPQW